MFQVMMSLNRTILAWVAVVAVQVARVVRVALVAVFLDQDQEIKSDLVHIKSFMW